jgi:hypothetical protein
MDSGRDRGRDRDNDRGSNRGRDKSRDRERDCLVVNISGSLHPSVVKTPGSHDSPVYLAQANLFVNHWLTPR